jgi:hypothetical protein
MTPELTPGEIVSSLLLGLVLGGIMVAPMEAIGVLR